jgi:hypothetical protein
MAMNEHYIPTQDDVLFMKNLVGVLADGGVWGFPGAALIYRHNKQQKVLTLLNLEAIALSDHSREMHERTIVVMSHLGYKVEPNTIEDLES